MIKAPPALFFAALPLNLFFAGCENGGNGAVDATAEVGGGGGGGRGIKVRAANTPTLRALGVRPYM